MNHKPWLWRKRSLEKTTFAMDKFVNPSRTIEQEVHKLPTDKQAVLERSSRSLNEKLASVLLDCHVADDPSSKQTQKSREETTGKDKAKEAADTHEKKSIEDFGKEATVERVTPSDARLQDSSQQSSCVPGEQERRACEAVAKISAEHENIQNELGEKLRETSKRIDYLATENTRLSKALLAKEKYVEDLLKSKRYKDAEFSTLMARLDSTEKENAFLRYEFHVVEKELEIRKEEMDYSRQYVDTSHKQYLEGIQKVSKLEAECQRLRLLVQKRSPSPTGLVTMKNEVGTMRRRKSNPTRDLICNNTAIGNSNEASDKSFSLMIKRLQDLDEENKALKRILTKKNDELDSSRLMYAQTASRLSQAEILLKKVFENHKSMELARCNTASNELPLISKFDTASKDVVSSSGSCANALNLALKQLRTGEVRNQQNNKATEAPDMSLLDDFVEMEKRAIVSVDTPRRGCRSDLTGRELVPIEQDVGFGERKQEIQFKYTTSEISFDWLQIVLNAMFEQKRVSKRSLYELIEDIKIALGCINHPYACKSDATQEADSFGDNSFGNTAKEKDNQHINSSLSRSIHRIIKLIEGLAPTSFISNNCQDENQHFNMPLSPISREYFIHVFQWKFSDLDSLLQRLVQTCKDLLTGRADSVKFVEEVAFALDWSINNCNASIARDKIKKHLSFYQLQHENENQIDINDPPLKVDTVGISNEESSSSPLVASPHDELIFSNMKNDQSDLQEENRKLKDDLKNVESARKVLEARLRSITDERQGLVSELEGAQNSIKSIQSEVETLKESKEMLEDQMEHQKLINEDLDTQLTIAQAKLNEFFQKFSSLEVELEDKSNSCEDLEATCLELQLQLESIAKESRTKDGHELEKISHAGWEITKASSKLAECQETILNLGKQVKALASSSEVALLQRVLSTRSTMANQTPKKNLMRRSSLHSQMQDEDDAKSREENKSTRDVEKPPLLHSNDCSASQAPNNTVTTPETNLTSEQNDRSNAQVAQAIVPSKKQEGFAFLRKLLLRRKKERSKGTRSQPLT